MTGFKVFITKATVMTNNVTNTTLTSSSPAITLNKWIGLQPKT